ncbi:MAG TPA: alginate export family protein [Chitinophagaceae bacterium]|nr:alginate export family protein [Chitinophagaceae bacterium]
MRKHIFFAFTMANVLFAQAQDFHINGEVKSRYEYRNGFGQMRPASGTSHKAASFVSQRSRLSLLYANPPKKLRLGASMQDVRNWGVTDQLNIGDKNNFSLHEFWGELLLSNLFSIKTGRQELNYDNSRILGNVDWVQQARSFDLALMKYEDTAKNIKIHSGFGLNTKSETLVNEVYDANNYKALQFFWLNKKFKNINASFLFLNNGLEHTVNPSLPVTTDNRKISYSQTFGFRFEFLRGKFDINTEGYYQGGKTVENKKVDSWNLGIEFITKPSKIVSLLAGAEWLSGTDLHETDGKNHSFNPFYGTNHKFNGSMDYFFVGGRWNNNVGLEDYYSAIRFQKNRFNAELITHVFRSAVKVVLNNTSLQKYLAVETDISGGYKLSDIITLQAGFSFLSASSTLEFLTSGSSKTKLNTWGWTQLIIKPNLFSSSKK